MRYATVVNRYRLTLLFAATALVVMTAAVVVVNAIIGTFATTNLVRAAEHEAEMDSEYILAMVLQRVALKEAQAEAVGPGGATRPTGNSQEAFTLEHLIGPDGIPGILESLPTGIEIIQYNVFRPDGVVAWSTDAQLIGKRDDDGTDLNAVREVSSRFESDQELTDLQGVKEVRDVVETYIPLVDPVSGEMIGVFEIYRDVTEDVALLIDDTKQTVLRTTVGTMGGLFFVLLGFIIAADTIIYRSRKREMGLVATQIAERHQVEEALRERDTQRRMTAQYAVTNALAAESGSLDEALSLTLRTVGETLAWDAGAVWTPGRSREPLRRVVTWHTPDRRLQELEAATAGLSFQGGGDPLGEVWTKKEQRWIPDLTVEDLPPRLQAARAAGLRAAVIVPLSGDRGTYGVLELYSFEARPLDLETQRALTAIGHSVGQSIEGRRAEETILDLSTPVLPIGERLLLVPIIGIIDNRRAAQLTDRLLQAVRANRAKVVVIDITGVPFMDSYAADRLVATVKSARLLGATAIVTGLSPEVAGTLVGLGVDLRELITGLDLQSGLEKAGQLMHRN